MARLIQHPDFGKRGERGVMAARITYADDGSAFSFPTLPEGALIEGITRIVTETFDDSGTDELIVGTVVDPNGYAVAAGTTLTSTGHYHACAGALVNGNGFPQRVANADERTITVQYDGGNGDSTQGSVDVFVLYALPKANP